MDSVSQLDVEDLKAVRNRRKDKRTQEIISGNCEDKIQQTRKKIDSRSSNAMATHKSREDGVNFPLINLNLSLFAAMSNLLGK